jgi:pilus assembly protein Flp/PilA
MEAAQPRELIMHLLKSFTNDESGATAIDYGLIAALVSIVIIAALNTLAVRLNGTFSKVSATLATAAK